MRPFLAVGFLLVFGQSATNSAEAPRDDSETAAMASSAREILREASAIFLKQGDHEPFWTSGLLLRVAELQIRAGDFDGAMTSIGGCGKSSAREVVLLNLGKALARAGQKDRAIEVSRTVVPEWGSMPHGPDDVVQLPWVEHLIAAGDLKLAGKAVEQIKSPRDRCEGLQKLAVACARSGAATRASKHFQQAIETAASFESEYDRARALSEAAEVQRSVGAADAANVTMHRLADETEKFKDPWAKVSTLRECAVLAGRLKDTKLAQSLFDRAIKSQQDVNKLNKLGALEHIAAAQASVGFIDDALRTASRIMPNEQDFIRNPCGERALYAIAVAQVNTDDAKSAVGTALSIKYFLQYRDDALDSVVAYHTGKRDFKAGLATTEKFNNPSRKATAILKVATAQAKAGDRKAAVDTAAQVKLTNRSQLRVGVEEKGFDYRRPQSWGVCYDSGDTFTMASHRMSVERAAAVAAAAMALSQALKHKPAQSYAVLFNDIDIEEVIRSLARTAALGDPKEAIAWAKQIGSGDKAGGKDDHRGSAAVQRRINALLGVAEGILDRAGRRE